MAYMNFNKLEKPKGKVTETWEVISTAKEHTEGTRYCILGYVLWRSGWRRYVFQPAEDTVFDAACLAELTEFLSLQTEVQQGVQRARRGLPDSDGGGPFDKAVDRVIARADKHLGRV